MDSHPHDPAPVNGSHSQVLNLPEFPVPGLSNGAQFRPIQIYLVAGDINLSLGRFYEHRVHVNEVNGDLTTDPGQTLDPVHILPLQRILTIGGLREREGHRLHILAARKRGEHITPDLLICRFNTYNNAFISDHMITQLQNGISSNPMLLDVNGTHFILDKFADFDREEVISLFGAYNVGDNSWQEFGFGPFEGDDQRWLWSLSGVAKLNSHILVSLIHVTDEYVQFFSYNFGTRRWKQVNVEHDTFYYVIVRTAVVIFDYFYTYDPTSDSLIGYQYLEVIQPEEDGPEIDLFVPVYFDDFQSGLNTANDVGLVYSGGIMNIGNGKMCVIRTVCKVDIQGPQEICIKFVRINGFYVETLYSVRCWLNIAGMQNDKILSCFCPSPGDPEFLGVSVEQEHLDFFDHGDEGDDEDDEVDGEDEGDYEDEDEYDEVDEED